MPVFSILIFLLSPFVSLIMQFKDLVFRAQTLRYLLFFQLSLCLYLSFVNGSIEPKSDLLMYKGYFEYASSHGLLEILDIRKFRDPLFFAYIFLLNRLFLGNWWIFLCFTTFLMSWLMLTSLRYLCDSQNLSIGLSAIALFLVAVNPDHFIWTNHLMRQMISTAIFLYGFSFLSTRFKHRELKCLLIMLASYLFHSSIALLILPSILSFILYQLLTFKLLFPKKYQSLYFLLLVLVTIAVGVVFLKPIITYVFSDIARSLTDYGGSEILDSTGKNASNMKLNIVALAIGFLLSVRAILLRPSPFYTIYSLFFLMYALLMFSLLSMPWFGLVAYRYLVVVFSLVFMYVPLLLTSRFSFSPMQKYSHLIFIVSCIVGMRYFYSLSRSVIDFGEVFWLIFNPLILLIPQ